MSEHVFKAGQKWGSDVVPVNQFLSQSEWDARVEHIEHMVARVEQESADARIVLGRMILAPGSSDSGEAIEINGQPRETVSSREPRAMERDLEGENQRDDRPRESCATTLEPPAASRERAVVELS